MLLAARVAARTVQGTACLLSRRLCSPASTDVCSPRRCLPRSHPQVWCLAVGSLGDIVLSGSHDRSLRRWERTEEPFFIEEEKEKRLESLFEADLEVWGVGAGASGLGQGLWCEARGCVLRRALLTGKRRGGLGLQGVGEERRHGGAISTPVSTPLVRPQAFAVAAAPPCCAGCRPRAAGAGAARRGGGGGRRGAQDAGDCDGCRRHHRGAGPGGGGRGAHEGV